MTFEDLRDYINFMLKRGKIVQIDDEVDVNLEIAELSRRATYSHLPPLLFTNIKNYREWKLITNIFYSIDAVKEILGVDNLEDIGKNFLTEFQGIPLSLLIK
jgi:3-octaprenyl-4hydroxybenzoate decarboxylase (EC 4.1.1.-)